MQCFEYKEAGRNLGNLLDMALRDNVVITKGDRKYRLAPFAYSPPCEVGKSPFAGIKCLDLDITTDEIVEIIREGREG